MFIFGYFHALHQLFDGYAGQIGDEGKVRPMLTVHGPAGRANMHRGGVHKRCITAGAV